MEKLTGNIFATADESLVSDSVTIYVLNCSLDYAERNWKFFFLSFKNLGEKCKKINGIFVEISFGLSRRNFNRASGDFLIKMG